MISIIKTRKIWFVFSGSLVSISLISFLIWGLNLGIDFTGGSLLELEFFTARPPNQEISEALKELTTSSITIQPLGGKKVILKFKEIDEQTHQQILDNLRKKFPPADGQEKSFEEERFDSIGPSIGQELRKKTTWAIAMVVTAIIIYIAWAFRKVSKPVASWKYGLIAVIAVLHDISITTGAFIILGRLYNLEVNTPFVAALLTVLGYSVNDTIIVFDRIRENLIRYIGEDFGKIIDKSINQVITRSINTSLTVLLSLFAILLFGGSTLRDFALALIIGIGIGTYSSIFLASPLLVVLEKFRLKA